MPDPAPVPTPAPAAAPSMKMDMQVNMPPAAAGEINSWTALIEVNEICFQFMSRSNAYKNLGAQEIVNAKIHGLNARKSSLSPRCSQ